MPRAAKDHTVTAWGALDWSHAPCKRYSGWAGKCVHCGGDALLYHPITGKPCHRVCDDKANGYGR